MSIQDLPTLNAVLNGTAAVLLIIGYRLIRTGKREAHKKVMLAAFSVSVLFLVSYLVYHQQAGSVKFTGTGPIRTVYFSVLVTHSVLAALVPFMALATLWRGLKGRFERHRNLARWTLPIWLYVSATGVAVYWMLYRM